MVVNEVIVAVESVAVGFVIVDIVIVDAVTVVVTDVMVLVVTVTVEVTVVMVAAMVVRSTHVSILARVSDGHSSTQRPLSSALIVRSRVILKCLHFSQSAADVPVQEALPSVLHVGWHGRQLSSLGSAVLMQIVKGS
jgi:hypothetical protein